MERLIQLKDFCHELKGNKNINKFLLKESEWEDVSKIVSILNSFNKCSKKLQSETVTLSDFFGFWTSLRIKLSKREDELSKHLLEQMNEYHKLLINNPVVAAAVYLDPRYQRALKNDHSLAINFLTNLFIKMKSLNCETDTNLIANEIDVDSDDSLQNLEEFLHACGAAQSNIPRVIPSEENRESRIKEILQDFLGVEIPLSSSVLEYWEKNKNQRPEMYQLASVVFAIPPTQTTVERAFSTLAIILTSRRTRLNSDCLEDILLVRLNSDLIELCHE